MSFGSGPSKAVLRVQGCDEKWVFVAFLRFFLNFSPYSIALPQDVSTFDLKEMAWKSLARPQLPGNYDQCQLSRMMMLMNQIMLAINTFAKHCDTPPLIIIQFQNLPVIPSQQKTIKKRAKLQTCKAQNENIAFFKILFSKTSKFFNTCWNDIIFQK